MRCGKVLLLYLLVTLSFLLSALAALGQSIELRSVTILGGVEIGTAAAAEPEPPAAEGSPGVHAAAYTTNQATITTTGVTNFVVSGSGKLLLVGIASWNNPARTVSSVVWNDSEALTELLSTNWYDTAQKTAVYYLKNPTAGTTNVLVTFSGTVAEAHVAVVLVTNANQTSTFGTAVGETRTASGLGMTNTITGDVGDFSFSYSAWEGEAGETTSVGADETLTLNVINGNKVSAGVGTKVFDTSSETNIVRSTLAKTYRSHITVPVKKP